MRKELVARAVLKSNDFFNTGFIHIKDDFLEGIFTLDYLKMCVYNNRILAHLSEKSVYMNGTLLFKSIETLYHTTNTTNLYAQKFSLYDDWGNELSLFILEPVEEPFQVLSILEELEKIRF